MLFQHQSQILEKNPKACGLFWSCGLGKTLTAIKLVEKNVTSCLVVCPKSVKINWSREIERWSTKERSVLWYVVTKEEFRRDWKSLAQTKYQGLILDEAHNFFGYTSQLFKNTMQYLNVVKPEVRYLLTATPYLSTPYNVMCLEALMGRKPNWYGYTQRFFTEVNIGGGRKIRKPKTTCDSELQAIIRGCGSLKTKEECLDLPETIFLREDFDLTPEQKRAIKDLDDNPLIANQITRFTKIHQICGGAVKDEERVQYLKSEKLERAVELARELGRVAIICRYNAELTQLKKAIPGSAILNGATSGEDRQRIIDGVQAGEIDIVLINAACSEGYNLHALSNMIFYSLSWSLKDRIQIQGRIHRIGQTKPCTYIDFVVPGTIDEDVWKAIDKKEDFNVELYSLSNLNETYERRTS